MPQEAIEPRRGEQRRVAERDRDEVLRVFTEAGVTAGPVYNVPDIIADEHVKGREVLIDLPDDQTGWAKHHNIHPRLSATPGTFRHPAPKLGCNTEEVLSEVGFGGDEIVSLRKRGVI